MVVLRNIVFSVTLKPLYKVAKVSPTSCMIDGIEDHFTKVLTVSLE